MVVAEGIPAWAAEHRELFAVGVRETTTPTHLQGISDRCDQLKDMYKGQSGDYGEERLLTIMSTLASLELDCVSSLLFAFIIRQMIARNKIPSSLKTTIPGTKL